MVPTVQRNFQGYSRREDEQAINARKLQGMIRGSKKADYKGIVCVKMMTDLSLLVP